MGNLCLVGSKQEVHTPVPGQAIAIDAHQNFVKQECAPLTSTTLVSPLNASSQVNLINITEGTLEVECKLLRTGTFAIQSQEKKLKTHLFSHSSLASSGPVCVENPATDRSEEKSSDITSGISRTIQVATHLKAKEVSKTAFAQVLNEAELERFSEKFELRLVPSRTVIFNQNTPSNTFFIIRKGEINLSVSCPENVTVTPHFSNLFVKTAELQRQLIIETKQQVSPRKKRRSLSLEIEEQAYTPKSNAAHKTIHGLHQTMNSMQLPSSAAVRTILECQPNDHESKPQMDKRSRIRLFASHAPLLAPHPTKELANVPTDDTNIDDLLQRTETLRCTTFNTHLATKRAGDLICLESLQYGDRMHTSCCITRTDCQLLCLSNTAFHSFTESLEDIDKQKQMHDLVGDSIQACLRKMPYLRGVSIAKLSLLSSLFVWHRLSAKRELFSEGERDKNGNGLYFLYSGTVGVYIRDVLDNQSKMVKELSAGVCFGELSLIIGLPRTASITAHSDCLLLHLPYRSFHNFLQVAPEILTRFREQLETYQLNAVYMLENEIISQYFFEHCAREFSTENLEFWWAAKAYRQNPTESAQQLCEEAGHIVDTFISSSSPKQVNLKGPTQKQILKTYETTLAQQLSYSTMLKDTTFILKNLFWEAESEILNLLATDSFSRFKSSPAFRQCLEAINIKGRASSISVPQALTPSSSSLLMEVNEQSLSTSPHQSTLNSPMNATDGDVHVLKQLSQHGVTGSASTHENTNFLELRKGKSIYDSRISKGTFSPSSSSHSALRRSYTTAHSPSSNRVFNNKDEIADKPIYPLRKRTPSHSPSHQSLSPHGEILSITRKTESNKTKIALHKRFSTQLSLRLSNSVPQNETVSSDNSNESCFTGNLKMHITAENSNASFAKQVSEQPLIRGGTTIRTLEIGRYEYP